MGNRKKGVVFSLEEAHSLNEDQDASNTLRRLKKEIFQIKGSSFTDSFFN